MTGKHHFSSDLAGFEVLGEASVPSRVSSRMVGQLGDPDASILFEVRDGRPECVEIVFKAKPDGRALRGADLEGINLNSLAEAAFLSFATPIAGGPLSGRNESETRRLSKSLESAVYAPGRGATAAELKEVARIYREHPRTPTAAVEKLMHYSRRTAGRRVQQARAAGLL